MSLEMILPIRIWFSFSYCMTRTLSRMEERDARIPEVAVVG
jgi:hypothetical protein